MRIRINSFPYICPIQYVVIYIASAFTLILNLPIIYTSP